MEEFNRAKLEKIGNYLKTRKQSIAVAESVTSGLIQFAFSTLPEAARFFQGGITAYNIGQKVRYLHVEPLHAQEVNCVSKKVALEMALEASRGFTSDWAVSITGYATPVPESDNKTFAFYAITYGGKVKASGRITGNETHPVAIQTGYVNFIIDKLSTLMNV